HVTFAVLTIASIATASGTSPFVSMIPIAVPVALSALAILSSSPLDQLGGVRRERPDRVRGAGEDDGADALAAHRAGCLFADIDCDPDCGELAGQEARDDVAPDLDDTGHLDLRCLDH